MDARKRRCAPLPAPFNANVRAQNPGTAHPQTLENVVAAFVNQSTLEEVAPWMASLALSDGV